jgi:hypothetical protein
MKDTVREKFAQLNQRLPKILGIVGYMQYEKNSIDHSSFKTVFLNRRAGPSSHKRIDLPGRGLTKAENHHVTGQKSHANESSF